MSEGLPSFSTTIKRAIADKGLTQIEFAERMDIKGKLGAWLYNNRFPLDKAMKIGIQLGLLAEGDVLQEKFDLQIGKERQFTRKACENSLNSSAHSSSKKQPLIEVAEFQPAIFDGLSAHDISIQHISDTLPPELNDPSSISLQRAAEAIQRGAIFIYVLHPYDESQGDRARRSIEHFKSTLCALLEKEAVDTRVQIVQSPGPSMCPPSHGQHVLLTPGSKDCRAFLFLRIPALGTQTGAYILSNNKEAMNVYISITRHSCDHSGNTELTRTVDLALMGRNRKGELIKNTD